MYKTLEQIENEYDGNWVFIVNCETNELNYVIGGEVAFHSKSMNEVLRNMKKYDPAGNSIYVRYFGRVPDKVGVVL